MERVITGTFTDENIKKLQQDYKINITSDKCEFYPLKKDFLYYNSFLPCGEIVKNNDELHITFSFTKPVKIIYTVILIFAILLQALFLAIAITDKIVNVLFVLPLLIIALATIIGYLLFAFFCKDFIKKYIEKI